MSIPNCKVPVEQKPTILSAGDGTQKIYLYKPETKNLEQV